MVLYINTTERGRLDLELFDAKGVRVRSASHRNMALECVFEQTRDFCGSDVQALEGVVVAHGPKGSFSSIRVGVAIANALGYGLKIPVLGISNECLEAMAVRRAVCETHERHGLFHPIVAHYDRPPKISQHKTDR